MRDKEKGITLVALVITIIILLILAGVAITALTQTKLFENAKQAKEKTINAQGEEKNTLNEYKETINEIVGSRETVTISKEDYDKLTKKGYVKLFEGFADTQSVKYSFKEPTMQIENYDFVLVEYSQKKISNCMNSVLIRTSDIIKDLNNNIRLLGYDTRYTDFCFTDNGFIIDFLNEDYKQGICYIYGINL